MSINDYTGWDDYVKNKGTKDTTDTMVKMMKISANTNVLLDLIKANKLKELEERIINLERALASIYGPWKPIDPYFTNVPRV